MGIRIRLDTLLSSHTSNHSFDKLTRAGWVNLRVSAKRETGDAPSCGAHFCVSYSTLVLFLLPFLPLSSLEFDCESNRTAWQAAPSLCLPCYRFNVCPILLFLFLFGLPPPPLSFYIVRTSVFYEVLLRRMRREVSVVVK